VQTTSPSWFHESLNQPDSETYWRARLALAASVGVGGLAAFAAVLQARDGSSAIAVFAVSVLLFTALVPLILRYNGSISNAVHTLNAVLFIALTVVNFLSLGQAAGSTLMLVLVPILALLAPGRVGPLFWSGLVLAELALLPRLESSGWTMHLQPNPDLAARAIYRIPFLLTLFILGGGLAMEKVLRDTKRAQHAAEFELAAAERERERLEAEMVNRRENLAAIGTLAAGVAHQINNPVGSILAAAQFGLLARGEKEDWNDPDRETLETIEHEARRCGRIVQALLRFSRGEQPEKWEEDLNIVVRTSVNAAMSYAREKQAQLDFEPAPRTVYLMLSPIEFEQAIVNLIHNAIESREVGARVRVETDFTETHAQVRVHDNGHGVDDAERERIFEPFYTTRQESGNSGLGLSVVKGVAEDHAGRVEIHPGADGSGSVFTLEIPIA